jgi:hypothetical protein
LLHPSGVSPTAAMLREESPLKIGWRGSHAIGVP